MKILNTAQAMGASVDRLDAPSVEARPTAASALFVRAASRKCSPSPRTPRRRQALSAARAVAALAVWLCVGLVLGQTMTLSDSTKPVASPDGSKVVIIDRIFRIIDGEVQRYPSRLLVRVVDRGGTQTRQRRIDASQVRLLNPPRWIDNRWAAFTYNISKNANGVVYVDTETAEAIQLEFVQLRRRMAATDAVETELTSFDVTEYTTDVVRVSNITRRNRSVFPLFLRPLPPYDTSPLPWVFVEQVRAALRAYRGFLAQHKLRSLNVEEASESFAPEEKFLAALACVDGQPAALVCPMEAESPAAALEQVHFVRLDPDIELACLAETSSNGEDERTTPTLEDESDRLGRFREYRFTTRWRDENTALIEQEIFESEEQEPRREVLYALTLDGKLEKLASPHKVMEMTTMTETLANDAEISEELRVADPSRGEESTATQHLEQGEAKKPTPTAAPRPATTPRQQVTSTPPRRTRPATSSVSATRSQASPKRTPAKKTSPPPRRTSR